MTATTRPSSWPPTKACGRSRCQPDVRVGPDRADAAGQLLRDQRRHQEPVHGPAVRRQHHPAVDAVSGLVGAAGVLPGAELHRDEQQPGDHGSNKDNVDQFLGRVDQNLGNKIRLSVRYNWHDSLNTNIGAIPVTGVTQPRVNKNTLVSYTHTLKPQLCSTIFGSATTGSTSTR